MQVRPDRMKESRSLAPSSPGRLRYTEEGDDSIANVLFDKSLISVNYLGDFAEDAGRDLLDLFGVELLGHSRVA